MRYRRAVGKLIYLMNVKRPDVAYATSMTSQYLDNYGREHWSAIKRILKYLKGTSNVGIVNEGKLPKILELQAYSDADYASDVDSRNSVSAHILTLAEGAISWSSKKQPTVTLSTTEAEY